MTRIIGDTTSGITLKQANELGIDLVPQIVIFGDQSYRDDTEIDGATFIQKLEASSELPKTAAPPPILYHSIFDDMRAKGEDAIIITPSQHVSGTYRSAMTARAEYPDLDIRIIDSQIVGCGDAAALIKAKKMADAGRSLDEISEFAESLPKRQRFFAVVDTLEYLYKGGRIGGAAKIFGDVLQIKPILTLRDGKVEPFEKHRTKKKALARVIDIVSEDCPRGEDFGLLSVSLQQSINGDELVLLRNEFKQRLGMQDVPFFNVPPAFMVHAGPGVIFVTYFVD